MYSIPGQHSTLKQARNGLKVCIRGPYPNRTPIVRCASDQVQSQSSSSTASSQLSTSAASAVDNMASPELLKRLQEQKEHEEFKPKLGLYAAISSVICGIIVFVGNRTVNYPDMELLKTTSVPLDIALNNGKPTIMEFYADWCSMCKKSAPGARAVRDKFDGKVNYAMLNIDNPKWREEISMFNVQSIPEFVFINDHGVAQSILVGNVPEDILMEDATALSIGKELPYATFKRSEATSVPILDALDGPSQTGPLDHVSK